MTAGTRYPLMVWAEIQEVSSSIYLFFYVFLQLLSRNSRLADFLLFQGLQGIILYAAISLNFLSKGAV